MRRGELADAADLADRLTSALENLGHEVWRDTAAVRGGAAGTTRMPGWLRVLATARPSAAVI